MRKIILQHLATVAVMMVAILGIKQAHAQTIWPVANDVVISMYNGMGNTNRYVDADKTGRLQFLMYGQDPTPGVPVGQLRPQRRVFGPSIVCGNTFDSTCDVVASAVSIASSQISDATTMGRSMMTVSDAAAARSVLSVPSVFDLGSGLSTKAPTVHTHPSTDITDSTAIGRALLGAASAASGRSTLSLGTAATSNAPSSGNAGVSEVVLGSDTRLSDARAPLTHTHVIGDVTGLQTALNGKLATPTGSTAQYVRGDGSLGTINRVVATTAADGTYTWTLPTACGAGQVPTVALTPFNATANEVINHKLTAVSNTTVTISLSRAVLTLNGLLGLTIPIIQTSPGAQVVHLIAVCP